MVSHDSAQRGVDQGLNPSLTAEFDEALSPNPWSISAHKLNQSRRPTYHLQFFLKNQVLILNQNWVKSLQSWACQLSVENDLAKFAKCWKQWIIESCEPISSMLGAKVIYDPKIKVVPLIKYYNFALVTTYMQSL